MANLIWGAVKSGTSSVKNTVYDYTIGAGKNMISSVLLAPSSEILIQLKQNLENLLDHLDKNTNDQPLRDLLHATISSQKATLEYELKKCTDPDCKTPKEIRDLIDLLNQIDAISGNDTGNPVTGHDVANLKGYIQQCLTKLNRNLAHNQGALGQALADAEVRLERLIANASTDFKETLRGHPEKVVELCQLLEKIADPKTRNDQIARDRLHALLTSPEKAELEAALKLCPDATCKGEVANLLAAADQVDVISSANTAIAIPDNQILALTGQLTNTFQFLNRNMRYNIGLAGQHLQQAEDNMKKTLNVVIQKAIESTTTEVGKVLSTAIRNHPDRLVELKKLLEDIKDPGNRDMTRMGRLGALAVAENADLLTDLGHCTDVLCQPEIAEINSLVKQINHYIGRGGDEAAIQRRLDKCLALLTKNMHANQGAAGKLVEDFQGIVGSELSKALTAASTEVNKIIRVHPDKVVELKKILEDVKVQANWTNPALLARLDALLTTERAALQDELKLCSDNSLHTDIPTIINYARKINQLLKGAHVGTTAASINNRLTPCLELLEKNMHANQGAAGKLIEDMQAIVTKALGKVTEEVDNVLRARPERLVEIQDLLGKLKVPATCIQANRDRFHVLVRTERALVEEALKLCNDPILKAQPAVDEVLTALSQVNVITSVNTGLPIAPLQLAQLPALIDTALQKLNTNLKSNQGTAGKLLVQAEDRIEVAVDRVIQDAVAQVKDVLRAYPEKLTELTKVLDQLADPANRDNRLNREKLHTLLSNPIERNAIVEALRKCSKPEYYPEIHTILTYLDLIDNITKVNLGHPIADINTLNDLLKLCSDHLYKNLRYNQGDAGQLIEEAIERTIKQAAAEIKGPFKPCPEKLLTLKQALEKLSHKETFNDSTARTQLHTLITAERHLIEEALRQTSDPSCNTILEVGSIIDCLILIDAITAANLHADIDDWRFGDIQYLVGQCLPKLKKNLLSNQGAAHKLIEDMEAIVANALLKVTEEVNNVLRARPERLVEIQDLLGKLKVPATCTQDNRDRFNVLVSTERALVEEALKLCEDPLLKAQPAVDEVLTALAQVNVITSVNPGAALGAGQVATVTPLIDAALQKLNTNLRSNQGTAGKLLVQAEDRIEVAVDRVIKDAVSQVKDVVRSYPEELVELTKVLDQLADPATRDNRLNREKLHALLTTPAEKDAIVAALKKCSKIEYHGDILTIFQFLRIIDAITYADLANPITDVHNLDALLKLGSDLLYKNLRYNQGDAGQLIEEAVERAIKQASAELKGAFKPCPEKLALLKQALEKLSNKETFNDVEARTHLHTLITTDRHLVEEALRQTSDPSCKAIGEIGLIMQYLVLIDNITGADLTADIDDWQLGNIQFLIGQCLPKLKKNLLSNQGVVGQLLTQVEDRVESIANRLIQQVNNKADDLLRGHPEHLVELKEVLVKLAKPETRDDLANRAKLRTLLTTQRPHVIEALNKCTSDLCKAEINALMNKLDQISATGVPTAPMFVATFDGVVKETLEQLKKNLQFNQGSFQMAAGGLISKFEEAIEPFNKLAEDLRPFAKEMPELAKQLAQLIATVNLLAERVGFAAPAPAAAPAAPVVIVPAVVGAPAAPIIPVAAPIVPVAPAVLAAGAAAPLSWISWTWVSSLLSQVSQKLSGAVSDAAFNATLSFIVYALKNAERHFDNNPQTQAVHGQIKSVVAAIESVLNAGPGHDQSMKWAHAKNAIDTLIMQINGARIYFNGMIGIPAFPMPFGNHPAILNELKQILDLLADPVHQHDQTTRNHLTQILATRGDELAWALQNCSNTACKADIPVILQQLSSIYNITAFNVAAPINAGNLQPLGILVTSCREKLNRNLESNSLKDPSEANTLPPIDAFALSAPQWNAPAPDSPPRDTAAIQASIETQICKLATHSSEFAYLKFINESICNGKLTKDYFSMIQQAKALAPNYQNNQSEALKDLLFTQIDNSDLWFFSKWIAKLTYYVMKPLTDHLIGDFSAKLTSTLKETLDSFEDDNFTKAQNQIVDGLSGYFSALSSAYTRVAAKPVITDTLDKELLGELQDPKLNGNYKPHDLYNKVVHKALNEFNPKAGWTEWLFDSLHKVQIPASSPAAFLNPVVKGVMNLIGGVASVFLFIPEKIIDFTIYRTVKSVIIKNQVLDRVLDESLSSLETPSGHTHAVNVIILNLLKKVWTQLPQEESNAAMQSSDANRLAVSDERKQKLRGLIESLFQVLAKSKHTTVEGLRNSLTSNSLTGAFSRNVDDLVGNNVVEPTIDILIQTFQEIMNKSQWLELAEQALQGINDSFENPTPVSPAEMVATQNEIAEYLRRVLHIAVGKAVDQKFDIDKKIQEREMDKCLHQLKGSTKGFRDLVYGEFTNGQRAYIGEMVRPIALAPAPAYGQPQHDHSQAWFTAVQDASAGYYQFAALEQATANFLNERLSEHTKNVYNNPMLDQKSKNELGAYYSTLIQKFDANGPYKAYVQFAKEKQGELYHWIQNYNAFAPAFGAGLMLQDFIQEPMQTPEVIDQARSSLPTIIDGLNQQGISFDMTALKFQLDRMHAIKKDNLAVVEEVSVLFEDFAKEKQGLLQNKYFGLFNIFSSLQEKRERLEARLLDLLPDSLGPDATYTRGVLLAQIKSIATSKDPGIVAANVGYSRQLLTDYKSNWTAAFNQIHNLAKDQVAELSRRMQVRVLEQRTQIQRIKGERDVLLGLAKEQLQLICQDIDKFEKKPILDVQIMQSLVKPLLSGIKSVTINLVQEKAEGCIRLVRNPANYRYGLFHRLVFLPYVGEAAPQA